VEDIQKFEIEMANISRRFGPQLEAIRALTDVKPVFDLIGPLATAINQSRLPETVSFLFPEHFE
jgi:hypothetical protein